MKFTRVWAASTEDIIVLYKPIKIKVIYQPRNAWIFLILCSYRELDCEKPLHRNNRQLPLLSPARVFCYVWEKNAHDHVWAGWSRGGAYAPLWLMTKMAAWQLENLALPGGHDGMSSCNEAASCLAVSQEGCLWTGDRVSWVRFEKFGICIVGLAATCQDLHWIFNKETAPAPIDRNMEATARVNLSLWVVKTFSKGFYRLLAYASDGAVEIEQVWEKSLSGVQFVLNDGGRIASLISFKRIYVVVADLAVYLSYFQKGELENGKC